MLLPEYFFSLDLTSQLCPSTLKVNLKLIYNLIQMTSLLFLLKILYLEIFSPCTVTYLQTHSTYYFLPYLLKQIFF